MIYTDVEKFRARVEPLLLQNEAVNGLMLGLLGTVTSEMSPLMTTVERDGELKTVVFQTPPNNAVVTYAQEDDLDEALEELTGQAIPGVIGPEKESVYFAREWCARHGLQMKLSMDQGVYRLSQVTLPQNPPPGQMRVAENRDLHLVMQWMQEFLEEATPNDSLARARITGTAERRVKTGEIFLWEAPEGAVAMAGVSGRTPNGIRVNAVYTPRKARRQGFASVLVAKLSQLQLDRGRKFCSLYTDLTNPTSNSIYQAVGYQWVARSQFYLFK